MNSDACISDCAPPFGIPGSAPGMCMYVYVCVYVCVCVCYISVCVYLSECMCIGIRRYTLRYSHLNSFYWFSSLYKNIFTCSRAGGNSLAAPTS